MWHRQTGNLFICNQDFISIRFKCPHCGTLNTFDDVPVPAFSDNYENHAEADVTEDDNRECVNPKCKREINISITNGPGGCLIQVPDVADNDIEYKL